MDKTLEQVAGKCDDNGWRKLHFMRLESGDSFIKDWITIYNIVTQLVISPTEDL